MHHEHLLTHHGRRSRRTTAAHRRATAAHRRRRAEDDRGQAAIVVVAVSAVLLVAVLSALAVMGRTTIDRSRAQTAADAAALASLDGGREAAVRLAGAHGATVVEWSTGPGVDEVTVTVRLGETLATARATDAP